MPRGSRRRFKKGKKRIRSRKKKMSRMKGGCFYTLRDIKNVIKYLDNRRWVPHD